MQFRKVKFHDQEALDEIVETIEGQVYHLVPNHHFALRSLFDQKHRYGELNQVSQAAFERSHLIRDSHFTRNLFSCQRQVLPADLCQYFIDQSVDNPKAIYHEDVMTKLLPIILNDEIDREICSYFKSEYTLFWYSYLVTEPDWDNRAFSSYWHCDKGPDKHLKMLIYLNDYDSHGGNTKFMSHSCSESLKKAGYIFGDLHKRVDNLEPLAKAKGFELEETMYTDIRAGDALLFAPCEIAHIGKIPDKAARHVLQLCFVPSPYPWEFTRTRVMKTITKASAFEGVADKILRFANAKKETKTDRVSVTADDKIVTPAHLKWLLHNMYAEPSYADIMFERLMELDPKLEHLSTLQDVLETLKMSFKGSIEWHGKLGSDNIANLAQLARFEAEYLHSANAIP